MAGLLIRKLFCLSSIFLGFLILYNKTELIPFKVAFLKNLEIIAVVICLFAIYDFFDVLTDSEIQIGDKLFGLFSNLLVIFAVTIILLEHFKLNLSFLITLTGIKYFYHILGIVLIADNLYWLFHGE